MVAVGALPGWLDTTGEVLVSASLLLLVVTVLLLCLRGVLALRGCSASRSRHRRHRRSPPTTVRVAGQ